MWTSSGIDFDYSWQLGSRRDDLTTPTLFDNAPPSIACFFRDFIVFRFSYSQSHFSPVSHVSRVTRFVFRDSFSLVSSFLAPFHLASILLNDLPRFHSCLTTFNSSSRLDRLFCTTLLPSGAC
ncbi:hypothetical protein FRC19_002425 [Serendipita sp. 401]|nr:hypothetical protein FRC19_002425 [Serendipita sp. 401]KAG9024657.1 hypothetical protein FS842_005431 [Serendipita sp. 407]